MTQKFYLRNTQVNSHPTAGEKSTTQPVGAQTFGLTPTDRDLLAAKGAAGTTQATNTPSSTAAMNGCLGRWSSVPLAAGTYGSGNWTLALQTIEGSTNANMFSVQGSIYFWRPGTSAVVGFVADTDTSVGVEFGNNSTARYGQVLTISGSNVTIQDGDILVIEVWTKATAAMAGVVAITACYDGTTDVTAAYSGTDPASYLQAPADIPNAPTANSGSESITLTETASGNQRLYPDADDAAGSWVVPTLAVQTTQGSSTNPNNTSHTVTMPSGVVAGDLLLAYVEMGTGFSSVTWPAGWTSVYGVTAPNNNPRGECRYKISDGTEGASITVTTGGSTRSAHVVYRIVGHDGNAPSVSTANTYPGPSQDCPALTPAGGSAAYLWIVTGHAERAFTLSSYPTNYGTNTVSAEDAGGHDDGWTHVHSSWRTNTASSEDPNSFTYGGNTEIVVSTLAVAPLSGGLYAQVDEAAYNDADYITSETELVTGTTSIAQISVSSGTDPSTGANHFIRVRAKATYTAGTNAVLVAELRQSGTLIATLTSSTLTTSYVSYEYALSTGEADAITDYTALALWIKGTFTVAALGSVQVSFAEVAIPLPANITAVADSDTDTLTDTATVSAVTTASETVTFTDAATIGIPVSDTGTTTETAGLTAAVVSSDPTTFTDAGQVVAALTTSDAITLTETVGIAIPGSDAGTVTDLAGITAALSNADAVGLTDTSTVAATLTSSDSGTLADAIAVIAAALTASDSATLDESASLTITPVGGVGSADLADADTATLTDSAGIAAATTTADTATTTETEAVGALTVSADTAQLADTGAVGATTTSADALTISDDSTLAAALGLSDSGTLSEDLTIEGLTQDSGTLSELAVLVVVLAAADSLVMDETGTLSAHFLGSSIGRATVTKVGLGNAGVSGVGASATVSRAGRGSAASSHAGIGEASETDTLGGATLTATRTT